MPHYRALAPLFLRKLVEAGEEFDSELPPGRNWLPLDDAARAAVEKYRTDNAKVLSIADHIDPPRRESTAVEIPADWATSSGPKRRALAKRLGAQANVTEANANSFIEAELERRGQKAA
jgi:hypothetical protein